MRWPVLFAMLAASVSATDERTVPWFDDVTATHLPPSVGGFSMDARPVDVDGDGDLDVVVAVEYRENLLLINDGTGGFTDESAGRLSRTRRDSEDVGVGDFDRDGDLDLIIVTEDDRVNELYLNDGTGRFTDASDRVPVTGVSNAVAVADLTGDGRLDVVIGNRGENVLLEGLDDARFRDATAARVPVLSDRTQDVELGDVDRDGDLDLLVGNEDDNRLLINDGRGVFTDESAARIPLRDGPEETREADFGDVDGDGDLDIVFGDVRAFVPTADPANRVLINDGSGVFRDETAERLSGPHARSFDVDFVDLDADGDLDLVTADAKPGQVHDEPFRVYLNDGTGRFTEATSAVFPPGVVGKGFDVEVADLNGDGRVDLYLASQGSTDRLLFGRGGPGGAGR